MKKFLSFAVAFAAIAISGCVKNSHDPLPGDNAIKFTSSIEERHATRAVDDRWEDDDEIGVYMLPTGEADGFSHSAAGLNVLYRHTGSGKFTPDNGQGLYWPGTAVDFVAYYPYSDKLHTQLGNLHPIDVTTQTPARDIDFMVSAKVGNRTAGEVVLNFSHKLSKLIFNVEDEDPDVSLEGMSVVIDKMSTAATYNIATGAFAVTAGSETVIDVPLDTALGNKATAQAIVLPTGEEAVDYKVIFSLVNGDKAELTMNGKKYAQGKKYSYNIRLTAADEPVVVGATINNWEEGNGNDELNLGDIEKTPGTTQSETKTWSISGENLTLNNPIEAPTSYRRFDGDHSANSSDGTSVEFTTKDILLSAAPNEGALQMKTSTGVLFNITDMGKIAAVVITVAEGYEPANNITVSECGSAGVALATVTKSETGRVFTYTFSGNTGFFEIKNSSSGLAYIANLTVKYKK